MNLIEATQARDTARYTMLSTADCAPWADVAQRMLRATPAAKAAYEAAVDRVREALRGKKYEGADPEYV